MPETPVARPTVTIYRATEAGALVCGVCHAPATAHAPDCAIVAVHAQVQELGAQLGLFVATMRETLDTVETLLRGEAG